MEGMPGTKFWLYYHVHANILSLAAGPHTELMIVRVPI